MHRLPAMFNAREFAELGGLIAYGASLTDLQRRSATYVDKIGSGFIASLGVGNRDEYDRDRAALPLQGACHRSGARPGGNLTGLLLTEEGIAGKWLAMLREIAPRLERAALLANPKTTPYAYFARSAAAAAPSLALELMGRPIGNAADIEREIESLARLPNRGLILPPDTTITSNRDLIIALAARHRLPAIYALRVFVAAGGLMSYSTDRVEEFRQAATYVDRILRGDKPADLPVQAPIKYETAINLKTAKALGLTVPSALLLAADEVIE